MVYDNGEYNLLSTITKIIIMIGGENAICSP